MGRILSDIFLTDGASQPRVRVRVRVGSYPKYLDPMCVVNNFDIYLPDGFMY